MAANPYDPVTTTDMTYLSEDEWGLTFPNATNVRHRKHSGSSRFKGLCQVIQENRQITVIICFTVLASIILIIVFAAFVHKDTKPGIHPTGEEPLWQAQSEGLEFYPVPKDKTIVISFTPHDIGNSDPIKSSLNSAIAPYDLTTQFTELVYTDCTKDNTPFNRTCRFGRYNFGPDCTKTHDYGYKHGMPCVFLQLNLPEHVMIQPITKDSPLYQAAIMKGHNDSSHVPVICQGKTNMDGFALGDRGVDGGAFEYYPPEGLPSYFYRERNMSLPFIKPAMMIRLISLKDNHLAHVNCTAWGQLFSTKTDKPVNHELLTTEFAVYIKH